MNEPSHFHRTAEGTIRTFLAEALILPTGLISAGYLTRSLGPDGYGLFSLAATLAMFAATTAAALFARGSIKLVAESDDWRALATTIVRVNLACGLVTALVFMALAGPVAHLLDEPRLTFYLMLFSLEPLLFVISRGHRTILIGAGRFRDQAVPLAVWPLARLMLIVVLVESGLSVLGAVLGLVGASAIELAVYRYYVHPPVLRPSGYPARRIWEETAPVFFASLFIALFGRIDLFALTSLGLPTSEAGFYAAAQNLSVIPGLFAGAFAPLLLSTLSRMMREGAHAKALTLSRDAMRLPLGMLPFAAMAAGAADEVVVLIFGASFTPTAPLLSCIIFAAVATVMVSVTFIILVASDRPALSTWLAAPMLALAIAGHVTMVPRSGSMGAAWVTTAIAVGGAFIGALLVYRLRRVWPPLATVARAAVLAALAWSAAALAPTVGLWLVAKLVAISAGIVAGFALLGEFKPTELAWARARLRAIV